MSALDPKNAWRVVLALAIVLWWASLASAQPVIPGGSGGAYEVESLTYFSRAKVTNDFGKSRIDGFVKQMKRDGLWNKLVDGFAFAAVLQPSNSARVFSLKGSFNAWITNAPVTRGVDSFFFDGAVDGGIHTYPYGACVVVQIPDIRLWTIAIEYASATNRTGIVEGSSLTCVQDSQANWVGGITNVTKTAGAPITNAMDTVFIGGAAVTPGFAPFRSWAGNVYSWLLFNQRLTDGENFLLHQAMRWLDIARDNLVIEGDSLAIEDIFHALIMPEWTFSDRLQTSSQWSNRFCIFNVATPGDYATNLLNTYDTEIFPLRPNANGVDRAYLYLAPMGYNDTGSGLPMIAVPTNILNFTRRAKADGFEVWCSTIHPSAGSSQNNSNLSFINSIILADRYSYDRLYRWDNILFTTNNNADIFGDNIHLTTNGYRKVAEALLTSSNTKWPCKIGYDNRTMTNNGAGATQLLVHWLPGYDLVSFGDEVEFVIAGGFTNNANAKQIQFKYGSEVIMDSGSLTLFKGPWAATIHITCLNTNSQLCRSEFDCGGATNFCHVYYAAQTNFFPTLCQVIGTGAASGDITNFFLQKTWKPKDE